MPPTSMPNRFHLETGPDLDRTIDHMLTQKGSDPLDPGEFPSLGFDNERRGSYFLQVTHGDVLVSVWRISQAFGAPETYSISTYTRQVYNGVSSWGGRVDDKITATSLVQVQAIIHHLITSGGNQT